jgi:cytochrome c biogenesis protein
MKRVFTTIFNQLASITLTIIVLSAISLLIGLQLATPKLQAVFKGSRWITVIASTDIFRSRVFIILLILFCINLIACTLKHLRKTVALFRVSAMLQEDVTSVSWMTSEVIGGRDVDNVLRILTDAVTRHFKKPKLIRGGSGIHSLIAERGKYTNLAFYLAHLSILTLVIGVIISLRGFTYYIDMAEGQVINPLVIFDPKQHEKRFDFALACEDFKTIYYTGTNKEMKHESTLSIVKEGKKVKTQVVDYGTSLRYSTIDIFQNRFVNRIPRANIQVITPQGEKLLYEVKNGEIFRLPEINLPIRAAGFRENSLQLLSFSPPDRLWISASPVRFFQAVLSGYQFSLVKFTYTEMTNLKVIYDPGKAWVWYSFLIMITGFFNMFFFSQRYIWATLKEQDNQIVIKLGGTSTKNPQAIRQTLEYITRELKEGTS